MKNKLVIFDFADTIAKLSPSKEELLHRFILNELSLNIFLGAVSIERGKSLFQKVQSQLFCKLLINGIRYKKTSAHVMSNNCSILFLN